VVKQHPDARSQLILFLILGLRRQGYNH